jgi:disulfide bond formation protein DsbB
MTPIAKWPTIKSPWILLAFSALAFELIALYFQYGMGLEPCIMCIYQRVAILGIMLAGFIGGMAPNVTIVRLVAYAGWAVSAIWGLLLAIEHVSIQTQTDPFAFATCQSVPNFPSWLQLHQWFPGIFEARGDCGSIDWQFLGLSMPQWMIVMFGLYTVALAVVFFTRLLKERKI